MADQKKGIILAIDDEPDLREMVQYQFQAKGFEVITAENGLEGLDRLKEVTPDLIILDMNMPKMGGLEFYQKICDQNARPKYPVLVLTARANLQQLFKDLDIHGFMTKPFDIEELIKQGEMIIKKTKRLFVKIDDRHLTRPRNICVVENEGEALKQISLALLEAGYKVDSAKSGTSAIEKMMMDPPDLALIKLGLKDIAGDIVAARLKRMSKTSDVRCILYAPKTDQLNLKILEKVGEKGEVAAALGYEQYHELVDAIDKVLQA